MKKIIWEVQLLSLPPIIKYCKKCGRKMEFVNSGQFRINAQRKYLDIWLIYKCSKCDSTWNVTIYSRISPDSLRPKLLDRFHENDQSLACQYGMDASLFRRNGSEIGRCEYQIAGDSFSFDESVELHIKCDYITKIKVSAILQDKLQLSKKALEDMIANGQIKMANGQNPQKCRLNQETMLAFHLPAIE